MLSWTAAPETLGVDEAADLAGSIVRELGMDTILARVTAAEQYKKLDDLRYFTEAATGASWRDPDDLAWRELRAEVAAALEVHENTAGERLDMARRLVHDFPDTHARLWAAMISDAHARALVKESIGLDPDLWAEYESRLLPEAEHLPLPRFRRLAAQVRASLEPEALMERHRVALEERRVWIEPAHDGMAYLSALLSAEDAVGASAAITGLARGLKIEGETRTMAQLEADVFRDLLVDATGLVPPAVAGDAPQASPGARRGLQPEVFVHVPVLTVLGHTDDPAHLVGYGPIDADTARVLCVTAPSFARVLTDPETGAPLSYGRSTYRVPADLKRVLQVRDETCRFVGCTRAAALCDIDHSIPWSEDGETVEANLAHLCRGHHRLKERGRWRIGRDPGGTVTWTSPTGIKYETKPAKQGFAGAGSKVKAMSEWLAPPF